MRDAVVACLAVVSCVSLARAAEEEPPRLFQSEMSVMAGMTAEDPMAGMAMPGWQFMAGVLRLGNPPSGPSAPRRATNWNMAMAQRGVAGGRLTPMS
jgi:hypothetical protein